METTIIELQERKSVNDPNNSVNGKFSISTKKQITLNDGDELNVRNVFIDSKKENNTIVVENDTTLVMNFIAGVCLNTDVKVINGYTGGNPWSVNGGNAIHINKKSTSGDPQAKDSFGGVHFAQNIGTGVLRSAMADGNWNRDSVNADPDNNGDTFTYFPCRRLPPSGGDIRQLSSIDVEINNFQVRAEGGNFHQQFRYINPEGEARTLNIFIPVVNQANNFFVSITNEFDFVLFTGADSLTPISPSANQLKTAEFNVKYTIRSTDTDVHKIMSVVENEATVFIEAGEYQPNILAQKINVQLNGFNRHLKTETTGGIGALIDNDARGVEIFNKGATNFLYTPTNITQSGGSHTNFIFDDNPASAYTFTHSGSDYYHMVSEDDSNVIIKVLASLGDNQGGLANEGNALYGGSTAFQVVFDDTTQTFKMVNLHTPYYVSVGNPAVSQVGMKLNKTEVFGNGDCMSLDTIRAEIRITALTSTGDGDDTNFWYDKLGFDGSIITQVGMTVKNYDDFEPDGSTASLYVPTFSNKGASGFGITKTAPFVSGELLVQNNKFVVDYMQNITYPVLLPNTDTIDIFAKKTLSDLIVDDAYFKIIIRGTTATSNRLNDTDGISLISALVGKYYSSESYTTGYSTDGITYVHRGEPITLSSYEVEILNSRNETPIIGTDNTIILQVNKNIVVDNNDNGK